MNGLPLALVSAAWLGFLCAISPCPLATNIAAIGFISRKVGKVTAVFSAGLLYTLGRSLTYAVLGMLLVSGLTAAPELSHVLQKYMNLLMGPLLIIVAMVLLKLLTPRLPARPGLGEVMRKKMEQLGVLGALGLGVIFALSFCPTSAALFFGSLLPLAIKMESGFVLPGVFGVATGLPVLVFAFLLAFSAHHVAKAYNKIAQFEVWAQRLTGLIFLLVGMGMTITITLGMNVW